MIKLFKPKRRYNKMVIAGLVVIASVVVSGWVLGYGQNNNRDGLAVDIDFSEANYDARTRTFTDQSGNGNHAVSANAANFAPDKDGKSAGAMRLNGASDYSAIANPSVNLSDNVTVSYWMYPVAYAPGYASHAISKSTINSTNDATFVDYFYGVGQANEGKLIFIAKRGGNWGSVAPMSNVLALNTWHFITWAYDKDVGGRLYINGAEVPGGPVGSGALGVNSEPIRLGHYFYSGHSYFQGSITGLKIFDRTLSSAEVGKLYSASKPKLTFSSLEKGLIGHWPLNQETYNASTGRATDVSAYSRHGVNGGSELTADRFGKANSAMQFDGGADDIIDIADTPKLPKFSLSAWVYNESGGDSRHSLVRDYWEIVGTQICFFSYDFDDDYWRCSGNNALPYNTWTQVVTTWDGSIISHYANGELIWSDPLTSGGTSQAFTAIGGYSSRKLKAKVSDVKIYDRALTPEEIKRAYDHNKTALSASSLSRGLVLDMPLTSAYVKGGAAGAEVMIDRSPYGNHAQNNLSIISADGVDMYAGRNLSISHSDSIDKESFSLSFWVKHRGYVYPRTFGAIKKSTPNCYAAGGRGWDIGHAYNSGGVDICIADGVNRVRSVLLFNNGVKPADLLNVWTHIVYVIDRNSNRVKAYINGVPQNAEVDISSVTGSIKNSSPLTIGILYGWYIDGNLSNLRMYNRILDTWEIKSLFDQGRGVSAVMMNQ